MAEDSLDGLAAMGGDLSPERLLTAYRAGLFPWFEDDRAPVLWWSPNPRAVIRPGAMRVTRSLTKRMRNGGFEVSFDRAFPAVIRACAAPRPGQSGTWVTPSMQRAYCRLHELGYAHSVEIWRSGQLVGGLYGLSLGEFFFGESMFSLERDASKIAFFHLCQRLERWRFQLIDCQIPNDHLRSLGARSMPRAEFLERLAANDESKTRQGSWDAFDAQSDDRAAAPARIKAGSSRHPAKGPPDASGSGPPRRR